MTLTLSSIDPGSLNLDTSSVSVNQNPTVTQDQLDAAINQLPIGSSSIPLDTSYYAMASQPVSSTSSVPAWAWAALGVFALVMFAKK